MLMTGHIVTACTQAIYLQRRKAGPTKTGLHMLGNHTLLDLVIHFEPSYLAGSYLVLRSLPGIVAIGDQIAGWGLLLFILMKLPEVRNRYLPWLLIAAIVPDALVALYTKGWLTAGIFAQFSRVHHLTHDVWGTHIVYPVSPLFWTIGISNFLVVLLLNWFVLIKYREDALHEARINRDSEVLRARYSAT